jgi:hypothetical protein
MLSQAAHALLSSTGSLAMFAACAGLVLEYQFEKSETKKANPSRVDDHCKS